MNQPAARPGTVYLVGAGPGDFGLVTQRALALVRSADVLLVDRLIPRELLAEARGDAECIDVGKTAGNHAMPQAMINARLVKEAKAGRSVVRIKGGDPYLFGRGGEEAMHCRAEGVPFEVVPAVTSAFAACADAGIPVTHRDLARHVTVVTASAGRDGKGDPDYAWLARTDGTLVLLMGLRRVEHVADQLIEHGMDSTRPAAVISRGTTSEQRVVTATLATLARVVAEAELASPAIIVVGDVVELREHLAWFDERVLFGLRIAVTRARAQSSELVEQLTQLGAQVVEVPTIRTERLDPAPLDEILDTLGDIDTLVLSSRNGAEALFDRLGERGVDARALAGTQIAVVGTATAAACQERGIRADLMPPAGARTSVGLLELLAERPIYGTRIAIVRAEQGDDRLPTGLEQLGVKVTLVPAYRTVVDTGSLEQGEALAACDLVTFTSESTVRNAVALLPEGASMPKAISIGPTTSAAARAAGINVVAEAREPSIEMLVSTLVSLATHGRRAITRRAAR